MRLLQVTEGLPFVMTLIVMTFKVFFWHFRKVSCQRCWILESMVTNKTVVLHERNGACFYGLPGGVCGECRPAHLQVLRVAPQSRVQNFDDVDLLWNWPEAF